MAFPSGSAPPFVSKSPPRDILISLLRKMEVSTLWSSFFLAFMWSVNCILGMLSFWVDIQLSMSAYHAFIFRLFDWLVLGYLTQDIF